MSLKSLHTLGRTCRCRESLQIVIFSASILTRNKGVFHTWFQRCQFSTSLKTFSASAKSRKDREESSAEVSVERIRNFSIIAHVDHGKSTLADRLLELTGAWSPTQADRKGPGRTEQVLDKLQVEQERGITVKAQCARLLYKHKDLLYHLNLIDTPGHVDFSNEVSRSVAVCQGVLLLVDANQGIQAQTLANYHLAAKRGLVVIPVLNKCDLKQADPDGVALQLEALLGLNPDSAIQISAKTGMGVHDVLRSIVERIPPPPADRSAPLRAVIFDGWMDTYKGAVTLLSLVDGSIRVGDRISVIRPVQNKTSKTTYEVKGLGQLCPEEMPRDKLVAGEVGFMNCGMKTTSEAALGSTVHLEGKPVEPFENFPEAKPVVFASIFPVDRKDFPRLRTAIERLTLNDSGVVCSHETTMALGAGFRFGFLGLLHMEVFIQRLENEYDADTIVTSPSVMYKALVKGRENQKAFGKEITVSSASNIPLDPKLLVFSEPIIQATVLTPDDYVDDVLKLAEDKRGQLVSTTELGGGRSVMKLKLPLNEIVVDFHDRLKSVTSGYASFDYEECGHEPTTLVKLDVLLNQNTVPELATLVHTSRAVEEAKTKAIKLRDTIPRRQFLITVQVAIGKTILARENIKPYRKDVTSKLYGGDDTRRMKLIAQQKAGKRKMRSIGNIDIPREVYMELFKT